MMRQAYNAQKGEARYAKGVQIAGYPALLVPLISAIARAKPPWSTSASLE
jgi:hypothetical protein